MPRRRRYASAFLAGLCAVTVACAAEEPLPAGNEFRFTGGESVTILVVGEPGGPVAQLVTADGFVSTPAGGIVNILDKTVQEASTIIANKVNEVTALKQARVALFVTLIPSRYCYVEGEVRSSQAIALPPERELYLAAALAATGGATPNADLTHIKVLRALPNKNGGRTEIVDGATFARPENENRGPALKPGDIVVVPRSEYFSVLGEVNKAGVFSRAETGVMPGRPVRLSHALAAAGGTKVSADRKTVRLVRTEPDGARKVLAFDAQAGVLQGDLKNDPVVQDGDQIIVQPLEAILIMGRVRSPGLYYPIGDTLSVCELIAMAGGFETKARKNAVIVVLKNKPGEWINVDAEAVMEKGDRNQDKALAPGDRVFVPGG